MSAGIGYQEWKNIIETRYGKIDDDTLLVFDEVQSSPLTVQYLKPWNEDPETVNNIVVTGSWVEARLDESEHSFPVGQVDFLTMHPLSFREFLNSKIDSSSYIFIIEDAVANRKPIPEEIHKRLNNIYKEYIYLGGMPNVIMSSKVSLESAEEEKKSIIQSYISDLGKYSDKITTSKLRSVYNAVPVNLSRQNNKFKYSSLRKGSKSRDYSYSLEWMSMTRVIKISHKLESPTYPLKANFDPTSFKVFLSDVGLLSTLAEIDLNYGKESTFNGWISENYIANQLDMSNRFLSYWTDGVYEIDFVIQHQGKIVPIDLKNGRKRMSNSMRQYRKKSTTTILSPALILSPCLTSDSNPSPDVIRTSRLTVSTPMWTRISTPDLVTIPYACPVGKTVASFPDTGA